MFDFVRGKYTEEDFFGEVSSRKIWWLVELVLHFPLIPQIWSTVTIEERKIE